jgi:hypothetical protein
MGRDLVQDHLPEKTIESFENLAIALDASLVQLRVIAQVGFCKLLERDVRLPTDAVATVENARSFTRLDVLRLPFVGRFTARTIPAAVDAEVVVPVVLAPRRGRAVPEIPFSVRVAARCGRSACTRSWMLIDFRAVTILPMLYETFNILPGDADGSVRRTG